MKQKIKLFFLLIIWQGFNLCLTAQKQFQLTGKIFNNQGEAIIGAKIKLVCLNNLLTTISDLDGNYLLKINSIQQCSLSIKAIGYFDYNKLLSIDSGTTTNVFDVELMKQVENLESINIAVTKNNLKTNTDKSLLNLMKTSPKLISIISGETINKLPDRNTAEIIKRLPGIAIQDNKFIIIRGLADRYNQVMLNGVLLGSTEPDRKTFSYDIFPTAMIDNIIVNKSFTADLPGEWAGGLVQIQTKHFPSKNFWSLTLQTGFNQQSTQTQFYHNYPNLKFTSRLFGIKQDLPPGVSSKTDFDNLSQNLQTAIGKNLPNNWLAASSPVIPNAGIQIVRGFSTRLFNRQFSGFLSWQSSQRFEVEKNRNQQSNISNQLVSINYNYQDIKYLRKIQNNFIGSINYKIDNFNILSYQIIYNGGIENSITQRQGIEYIRSDSIRGNEFSDIYKTFLMNIFAGEHQIINGLKLDWSASNTNLLNSTPDQRRIVYTKNLLGSDQQYFLLLSNSLSQQSGSRIYKRLIDNINSSYINLSYDYLNFIFKGGWYGQVKRRDFKANLFANYLPIYNPDLLREEQNKIFESSNFGNGNDNKFAFGSIIGNDFNYVASTVLHAGFLSTDYLLNRWRFIGGLRLENYDQIVARSFSSASDVYTHTIVLDYLPSINIHYSLTNDATLRFSLTKTVIRPELRELSYLNIYDFDLNASVQGNPDLKRTAIINTDLRYEYYGLGTNYLIVGLYFKTFTNPIEQILSEGAGGASTFGYQNARQARVFGVEFEGKRKLDFIPGFKNFSLQANFSLISSNVKDKDLDIDRQLQGQSNYIINLGLLYKQDKLGLDLGLLYHQYGDRIFLIGDIQAGASTPNVYEKARPIIDFQASKFFNRQKSQISFQVQNLLNNIQIYYQNVDNKLSYSSKTDMIRYSRIFGTRFQLSYKLNF